MIDLGVRGVCLCNTIIIKILHLIINDFKFCQNALVQ